MQCDMSSQASEFVRQRKIYLSVGLGKHRNHLTEAQWDLEQGLMVEGTTLFHWCIMTKSTRSPCKTDLCRLSQNKGCADCIVKNFMHAGMLGNDTQFFHAKKVAQAFQEGNIFWGIMTADYHFVPWTLNGCINACLCNLMLHCCF